MRLEKKMWIGIGILVLLAPLGLILPDHFKAGSAWGEWGPDEIRQMVGYIPQGLARFSELWKAPLPDYAFQGWEDKDLSHLILAYIVSAVVGIASIAGVTMFLGKLLSKKDE